jgi:hypothetical protein
VVKKKQDGSSRKTKTAPRAKASKPSKIANAVVSAGKMTEENKRTASAAAAEQRGLSSEMIGETAGDVWRTLSDRGSQTLAGLKKSTDAPDDIVLLAIGWLAREDKLAFETNGRTVTVSLRSLD